MRFSLIELNDDVSYSFVIGTAIRPDNALKESLRAQIQEAMESLGRAADSYSVSIVRNPGESPGGSEVPPMQIGGSYILFAMLSGDDPTEVLTEEELAEFREELAHGLTVPPDSRIALVILYNAIVSVIESQRLGSFQVWLI